MGWAGGGVLLAASTLAVRGRPAKSAALMPSASLRVPGGAHAVPSHGGGGSESWEEESYGSSQGGGGPWRGSGGAATVLSALREVCATCEDALNEAGGDYISFELQPEYVLKLRKRTPLVTLGLNLETHAQGYELVAKRGTQDLPLWKARAEVVRHCLGHPLTRRPPPQFVRRIVAAPDRGEVRFHRCARCSGGSLGAAHCLWARREGVRPRAPRPDALRPRPPALRCHWACWRWRARSPTTCVSTSPACRGGCVPPGTWAPTTQAASTACRPRRTG